MFDNDNDQLAAGRAWRNQDDNRLRFVSSLYWRQIKRDDDDGGARSTHQLKHSSRAHTAVKQGFLEQ